MPSEIPGFQPDDAAAFHAKRGLATNGHIHHTNETAGIPLQGTIWTDHHMAEGNLQLEHSKPEPTVADFLKKHPGFVPDSYPPTNLSGWLDAEVKKRAEVNHPSETSVSSNGTNGGIHIDVSNGSERPRYDGPNNRLNVLARMGVYNSEIRELTPEEKRKLLAKKTEEGLPPVIKPGEDVALTNIDLHSPEAAPVMDFAKERLRDGSNFVILPYAAEPKTIRRVAEYAMDRVGKDNVIAVSVGIDPDSDIEAQKTGVKVINQNDILNLIDWHKLKEEGILPQRFPVPAKGSKGLTMYAGILALKAMGRLEDANVMFHDTDITNPEGYAALEHLILPTALPVGETHGAYVARTGEGRNNEPWTLAANMTAISHSDPTTMKLGMLLGAYTWPLTGERSLSGTIQTLYGKKHLAESLPWSSGMGIETTLNVGLAGIDLKDGTRKVMEVLDPNEKKEDRTSPRDREFAIVYRCAAQLQALTQDAKRYQAQLHEWVPQQIGTYNDRYGGKSIAQYVPSGADGHQPNEAKDMITDYILPSIAQLDAMGVVDWKKMREVIERSAPTTA